MIIFKYKFNIMKNLLLLLTILLTPYFLRAQGENFQINKDAPQLINQYVVIKKDSMSVSDGFNRIIEWVNKTYDTPKEVIKAQLENKYIRIKATKYIMIDGTSYNVSYSLTFEFKENKIKMEITELQLNHKAFGWINRNPTYDKQFEKNGEPNSFIQENEGFINTINGLRLLVENYVNNSNKDGW